MLKTSNEQNIRPLDNELVRVKTAGNITEILYASKIGSGSHIKKLDKDYYIDLQTGDVRPFNHIENRSQALKQVAESLERGRDLLNANITDVKRCRWVTLTYAENMQETKKLYFDWMNAVKRLHKEFGEFEYIIACEPQGRGAWHIHAVMIYRENAPYMDNSTVADCWKQGFVTVKRLENVDNVGAYLTAYLGDMEIESDTEASGANIKTVEYVEDGIKKSKKYVKGARLYLYPPQFHMFRYSKGIKKPEVTYMDAEKAEKKVSGDTLTYEKTITLSEPEKNFESVLNYRYYNSIKGK